MASDGQGDSPHLVHEPVVFALDCLGMVLHLAGHRQEFLSLMLDDRERGVTRLGTDLNEHARHLVNCILLRLNRLDVLVPVKGSHSIS
jgi:hypothetical protein